MPTPAPITLGRVQRLFALLCDLGLDVLLEPPAEATTTGPTSIADQAPKVVEVQAGTVTLNLAALVREVGRNDGLVDLAQILYDVTAEEAAELPIAALEDALVPFVSSCSGWVSLLRDFVGDLA